MTRGAVWLSLSALVSSCYLSPDVADVHPADGSVSLDTGSSSVLDAGLDASIVDASDAAVEPADAGCENDIPALACPANAAACNAGSCSVCTQQAECARFATTPVCAPNGACVACDSDHKSLCAAAEPACDPASYRCVQCVSDPDCPSDKSARCQADHTCGVCTADAQCARFNKVCDTRVGACVACRPETEEADCRSDAACDAKTADCPGTACDPKTFTCSTKLRHTLGSCEACVSDSECVTSSRCVALTFGQAGDAGAAKNLGGFCLKRASLGCSVPYANPLTLASLSGAAPEMYCGINQAIATCAAVKALDNGKLCASGSADSCNATGARCETVNNIANVCTYSCSAGLECPAIAPCGGPAATRYCGGGGS